MSDACYRPLIEDMTWSYSRITCFEDCPYRWYMKYISGMNEKPMFYSSYGKFMHKLIEMYYKGKITKDEMKTKFLFDFSSEVQGDRPSEKIVASYIQKGIDYLDGFSDFPYEAVAVEDRVTFDLDGIPFVGAIDYVGKDDSGYVIIDNKSRELKQRSTRKKPTQKDIELDDMLKQLYVYSAAIKSKYGELPKKLCFNCFKNQQFIEEDFDKKKYEEVIDWVKRSVDSIAGSEAEDFYPNIEFFGCHYICGLSDECCYWNDR